MTTLGGMTAVVAGAGPGVGRACATALRREGADVVVAARDVARLDAMVSEMLAAAPSGPQLLPIAFDFADLDSCRALVDRTLDLLGRIDILVNVATAGGATTAIAEGEWESWRRAFEVNVIGTMELSRLAARAMTANPGGSVIQVGTIGTRALPPGRSRYTATKSAMVTASLTMAKELGRSHVRVNVVTPGFTTGAPLDRDDGVHRHPHRRNGRRGLRPGGRRRIAAPPRRSRRRRRSGGLPGRPRRAQHHRGGTARHGGTVTGR